MTEWLNWTDIHKSQRFWLLFLELETHLSASNCLDIQCKSRFIFLILDAINCWWWPSRELGPFWCFHIHTIPLNIFFFLNWLIHSFDYIYEMYALCLALAFLLCIYLQMNLELSSTHQCYYFSCIRCLSYWSFIISMWQKFSPGQLNEDELRSKWFDKRNEF